MQFANWCCIAQNLQYYKCIKLNTATTIHNVLFHHTDDTSTTECAPEGGSGASVVTLTGLDGCSVGADVLISDSSPSFITVMRPSTPWISGLRFCR